MSYNYNMSPAESPTHFIVQEIERGGAYGSPAPQNLTELMATPEIQLPNMESVAERDYDVEPTKLYTALQKKRWSDALSVLEEAPDESRTWVYRKEADGPKLRWRLLPIHGAIIFQAPVEVVESILLIYPESAAERDDEGSLPIHLAYKRAAPTAVCKLLLDTFPNSIDIADRKGRTPKHLAASSTGPKHREFVYAMKNHLLALQSARVSVRSEERLKFTTKLDECKREHEQEISALEKQKNSEINQMAKKIDDLEADLRRTQGASQVLVSHVSAMEAKISQFESTDREMRNKIQEMEGDLATLQKERDETGKKMEEEISLRNQKLVEMQAQVKELLIEKEVLKRSLEQVIAATEMEKKMLESNLTAKEEEMTKLKNEKKEVHVDNIVLKAEIKDRALNEASLSQKVASLEAELKEANGSASDAANAAKARLEELDIDRLELRMTVGTLTKKLRTVAGFLDDMTTEQDAIIEQADVHEAEMRASQQNHARILDELQKQQDSDAKAQSARELILSMVHMHEEMCIQNIAEREKIVSAIDRHSKNLSEGSARRQILVSNVKTLQDKIRETRERVLGGLPQLEDRAGEFSSRFGEKATYSSLSKEESGKHPVLDMKEAEEYSETREVIGAKDPNAEVRDGSELSPFQVDKMTKPRATLPQHKEEEQQEGKRFDDEKKESDEVGVVVPVGERLYGFV